MSRALAAFACVVLLSLAAVPASGEVGVYSPQLPLPPDQAPAKGTYLDPMPRPKGDPHVPYNQQTDFANQDYFSLDSNPRAGDLINLVERVHMGSQDNERGFWKHFYAGETNYALEQLKYVLWVFPNHPVALHMLGVMAKDMGSPTVPIAYYEKAIQLFPHVAYTYAQYGAYLVEIGYARQGMIELRQALAMDPSLVQAQAWLSKANAEVTLNTKK